LPTCPPPTCPRKRSGRPGRILAQPDARGRDRIDGALDLIDGQGEAPLVHADRGLFCLADAVDDLVEFDLEAGIVLGLRGYLLTEGVVFPRVGRDIGEDAQLVDVG